MGQCYAMVSACLSDSSLDTVQAKSQHKEGAAVQTQEQDHTELLCLFVQKKNKKNTNPDAAETQDCVAVCC